uniref:Expansin-like EG45 domain-containing protein n=1 Tax=Leersia perrieri TaxID=77586 RepID=A0A0D9XPW7_9ORYZ
MASRGAFIVFAFVVVLEILSIPISGYENNTQGTMALDPSSGSWHSGAATWNGDPHGRQRRLRSVGQRPFSSMVAGGGPLRFEDGEHCGACYQNPLMNQKKIKNRDTKGDQGSCEEWRAKRRFWRARFCGVSRNLGGGAILEDRQRELGGGSEGWAGQVKCIGNSACSGNPVTVVITDSCTGGPRLNELAFFDMSGTAFGAMANRGMGDLLRNEAIIDIQYRKVPCKYDRNVEFKVDAASNPYYFAILIKYESGDGDLIALVVDGAFWGATWAINSKDGKPLRPPFSIWLTSGSGHELVANDVIHPDGGPGFYLIAHEAN